VDSSLLLVAALAAVVAVVATVVAWRAGRKANRAADLVTTLLDPPVVPTAAVGRVSAEVDVGDTAPVEGAPEVTPSLERPSFEPPSFERPTFEAGTATTAESDQSTATGEQPAEALVGPPLDAPRASRADRRTEASNGAGPSAAPDPEPARIPVLDLDRLRSWLTLADVKLGRLAIVSIELDNLGFVEERLGYAAGGHLVEAITERLRTLTRPRDVVAHVSRERFVLVCRDVPDRRAAQGLAERLAMGVAHPSVVLAGVAEVTASIGIALAGNLDEHPEKVLRRAIEAGNHARTLGGARIEIADTPGVRQFAEGELAAAVAREELRLHYLPIVSCSTGRVAGFEALLRWQHPQYGLLLPGDFLAEAEDTGMIVPVGMWAIEQSCRQMAAWQDDAGATLKLDLNLSGRQFADPALPAQLKRIVGETGLAPGAIWLEITERTLLHDRAASEQTFERLRELGVRLVIDDFGTGASSLVSLKQFPLDAIKMASTFVAGLGKDRESDVICGAVVELAHSLGLCAIAEGVETLEQFAALRALDCELAQGHLFGRARSPEEYGASPSATLGVVRTSDGPNPLR
jgi:diguanylate cyclase (GGDEF)-like protein